MKPKPLRRIVTPVVAVPRLWPGSVVVCIASGPSLTREDVEYCRGRARVIAVNDAFKLAPWADVLYAADAAWWKAHPETKDFAGLKFSIHGDPGMPVGVQRLRNTGPSGLERQPTGLRSGSHSGFQSVGLARHCGAKRIILLGFDCARTNGKQHWFGKHHGLRETNPAQYPKWAESYKSLIAPLAAEGVTIVNCTRETAITCFPRRTLAETLADVPQAVAC